MRFTPKIQYNNGVSDVVLTLSEPQKFWLPRSKPLGGRNVSDSGIPESYVVRRDQLVDVELRFTEAEWSEVATWLEYVQDNSTAFSFWFDASDDTTEYVVYLEEPSASNEEIAPSRDDFSSILTIRLVLRSTTAIRFDVRTR